MVVMIRRRRRRAGRFPPWLFMTVVMRGGEGEDARK
jgi:hypothetical protein